MDKDTRNAIERATQRARKLLEEDFAAQLDGDFDVHRDGTVAAKAGGHLSARQAFQRDRIVAAIEHKHATGMSAADAARDYLRDAAFTTLNRFVALKMLEVRELVRECITRGEMSSGYVEFCGMAPGVKLLPDSAGYRLYIESLFDELSTEVKVLFDRRDPSSVLWPKRATFEQVLEILNASDLSGVWGEDETIGWVYQFFNGQDERRKMREESQAPRNSRELAVRNQFFTPRYVVQFLTDNTLGRIWYEMCGTKTALAERCEYMVRRPGEEFAPRAKKDPRDLRVLDPACGSGHFLLYAFDLLLSIYEEAYADSNAPKSEATGKTLAEEHPSLDALRKAVPGLVLAYNLHGVDIDARCAQIAQLALWMRAQKAYRDLGIGRAERAQIRRSNIIVAEPLVATKEITSEFVAKLGDAELGRVFTALVESLNLAGDLGLLLRVEQLVTPAGKREQTAELFAPTEERLSEALHRFVSDVATLDTRHRLFIDDAAQGLGLLRLAAMRFDAVLTNPPYGEASTGSRPYLASAYPETTNDLFIQFVIRAEELLAHDGICGALTSRNFMFNERMTSFRQEQLLGRCRLALLADLGSNVLDAAVDVATFTASVQSVDQPIVFMNVVSDSDRQNALVMSIRGLRSGAFPSNVAVRTPSFFRSLPDSRLAYSVPDSVVDLFERAPRLSSLGKVLKGLITGNDERYVRAWFECEQRSTAWRWFHKGGDYAPYYSDVDLKVKWGCDGAELKADAAAKYGSASRTIKNEDAYGRPGVAWGVNNSVGFAVKLVPPGCVFADIGPMFQTEARGDLLPWLAFLNSETTRAVVRVFQGGDRGRFMWIANIIEQIPCPNHNLSQLRSSASDLLERFRFAASLRETSPIFGGLVTGTSVAEMHEHLLAAQLDAATDVARHSDGIEKHVRELFEGSVDHIESLRALITEEESAEFCITRMMRRSVQETAKEIISVALGCAFGRWNTDRAFGRVRRELPQALDPLPLFSPAANPNPTSTCGGILVDDEGHPNDVAAKIDVVLGDVWGDSAGTIRDEIAQLVSCSEVRGYLRSKGGFFEHHLTAYTTSRRKAPIYWQLATPTASYSVWLYVQAFSKDTLFRVQNEFAAPKLSHEERRLESLTNDLGDKATASQRKELAAKEAFVEELRTFHDEVKRIAPLWKPNLDDGVILNFAPLWRLVPHHKQWQKELKSIWDALSEGKYDWAQLAMHLWPERVVPKCAKDRSLAIAHGLEDVFWVESPDGKWIARKTPTKSVDELVEERTSPAVKSSLKSLLDAPVGSGKTSVRSRVGGGRKSAAALRKDA